MIIFSPMLVFILLAFVTNTLSSFQNDLQQIFVDDPNESSPVIDRLTLMNSPSTPVIKRRSESAEKYFNWIKKTQRPVEYFRGKRFWLFAKKDDSANQAELLSSMNNKPSSSLTQGLWRSGIVGRRRR